LKESHDKSLSENLPCGKFFVSTVMLFIISALGKRAVKSI
jgi:hypothetical protein